ncbi:hypothetical protein ACFX2G_013203 [Malus domestica]
MKKNYVCLPCYGGCRWTVIGSSLILVEKSSTNCSAKLNVHVIGVDDAEKDWRLFDIWDRRFEKLPVISAKLSLRVMGADASGKARCLSDF